MTNWKHELNQLQIRHLEGDAPFEEVVRFKNAHVPTKLYKYRSLSSIGGNPQTTSRHFTLDNLRSNTLWLANPGDFNDPFDSAICMRQPDFSNRLVDMALTMLANGPGAKLSGDQASRIKGASDPLSALMKVAAEVEKSIPPEQYEKLLQVLRSQQTKFETDSSEAFSDLQRRSLKIVSLSERIDSILMWSHYGDSHKGIAVEYNFSQLPDRDLRKRWLWPVVYENSLFDLGQTVSAYADSGLKNVTWTTVAATRKAEDWAYESEWRVVAPLGLEHPPHNKEVPRASAVYLGAKVADLDREEIKDICNKQGIQLFETKVSNFSFELTFNAVGP